MKLNKENVLKGAQNAKEQLGDKELKIDPTKDVERYYEARAKEVPPAFVVKKVKNFVLIF